MLLFNLVYGALALISWSAFFYKVRHLVRDWRNGELRLVCLAIASFATPFVVASPWVYVRVDRLLGIPNIATLIVYCSVAVSIVSFLSLLVSWSSAQDRVTMWHRLIVSYAVITVAAMITLFFLGDVSDGEHHVDFDTYYAETPYITEFLLAHQLLYTVGMVGLARMCRRYAAVVDRVWLRRGLKTIAAGAIAGLGYGPIKIVTLVWDLVGTSPLDEVNNVVAPMSASVSAWLFAAGFTMPAWGVGLDRARERVSQYRAYRRLQPLWSALTRAFPEVILFPDLYPENPRRALRDDDLAFLVSRQVIEIRDAQLALRPYVDPEVSRTARSFGAARGLSADHTEAIAEAAQIKSALRAMEHGRSGQYAVTVPHDPAAGDMGGERDWLIRVAEAFRRYDDLDGMASAAGKEPPRNGAVPA
ncbi:MAB_1171c family putative transporter [Streptomyces sp. bgisy100]|uniref:MAB_1171c family putative transporter n=1 Tax=Streptomyces sp. bgisy100 TaxID=3413783 RepID=UPI003D726547